MEWFIWLLFGHLFGDYVFQNDWMAQNKKDASLPCVVHCIIYTFIVWLFLFFGGINPSIFVLCLLYLSHYAIDSTKMVDWWFSFYEKTSWDTSIYDKAGKIPFTAYGSIEQIVRVTFGAFVYVVVDNTLHLFLMFLIIKYVYF